MKAWRLGSDSDSGLNSWMMDDFIGLIYAHVWRKNTAVCCLVEN